MPGILVATRGELGSRDGAKPGSLGDPGWRIGAEDGRRRRLEHGCLVAPVMRGGAYPG